MAVLVGEGPGDAEVESGRPFVGPTGKALDGTLEAAGLGRGRLFVVNATCCRPTIGGKSEAAMSAAVSACAPAFRAQIARHKGKPHFAMGKWAWHALAGRVAKGGLTKGRGFLRKAPDGTPFIATWHPTYAYFRNPFESGAFEVDVGRFKRQLDGRLRPGPSRLLVHPGLDALRELVREGGPISVDIECGPESADKPWTGKDPTRAVLRTVGFGNATWGLSYMWNRLADSDKREIGDVLLRSHTVWQNGPWYDHRVLRRSGFVVGRWDDTRDLRMSLDPTSPLSLAYLASLYDDCIPWKESDEDDDKGLVFTEDMDELCTYNAQDCVETARTWDGEVADWEGHGGEPSWVTRLYQAHKRTSVICAKMHTRGIQVHTENRNRLSLELAAEFDARERVYKDLVGSEHATVSAECMRALLFKRHAGSNVPNLGLPDPWDDDRWSSDGTISCDQNALMAIATDPTTPPKVVDIINAYWQAYAVRQARSTFVTSELVEHAIGVDGRLRPGWNSCGADTGRKSCNQPNVMNLSKEKD
jgi:uracil-DNA glycosylase family 4